MKTSMPGKTSILLSLCVAIAAAAGCQQSQTSVNTEVLVAEAQALVQQFAGQLKPQLQQAMEEGGASHAIEVCSAVAPVIASELSASSGWSVKRVSLRQRNHTSARPDDWETARLEEFNQRQAAGEAPGQIRAAGVTNGQYRYMQAQGVEPLCLACHGQNISAEVREALRQHYPEDQATGYSLGEVRGAISLIKDLP